MPGDNELRRGVCSPAEAAPFVASRHGIALDELKQLVIDGCRSGEIAATVLAFYSDDRGRRPATPADFDDSYFAENQEAEARPALIADPPEASAQTTEAGSYSLGIIRILLPVIEISLLSLFRYTDAIFGQPPGETQPAPPKNPGGRPAKHERNHAMVQILLRVRDLGIPNTQAELVNETLDWLSKNSKERSCPKEWCKSGGGYALSGRASRCRQAAAMAGSLTKGSSLRGAMVSRVM